MKGCKILDEIIALWYHNYMLAILNESQRRCYNMWSGWGNGS